MKRLIKQLARVVAVGTMFPFAALSGFGRIPGVFLIFAQSAALIPGLPGDYLRVAFYFMTLERCYLESRISFGTFFAQSSVKLGRGTYIGSYCIIGSCEIGHRAQVASQVQVLSGRRQHGVDESGRIQAADESAFVKVKIGDDCWLGAGSIIMADVGAGTTIGAGSVVPRALPENVVAVGNPAREIRKRRVTTVGG